MIDYIFYHEGHEVFLGDLCALRGSSKLFHRYFSQKSLYHTGGATFVHRSHNRFLRGLLTIHSPLTLASDLWILRQFLEFTQGWVRPQKAWKSQMFIVPLQKCSDGQILS